MAAEKRGIYFGRMLNLLVSTFRPRTERDFPSNNPQPIEITAFLRRIYFGRACHKITAFQPESGDFSSLLQLFWTSPFSGHLGDPNRDPDGAKNRPGGGIFASGLTVFSLASEGIRQNFSHGLRRFLLGRCGDVGIGV